MANYSGGHICQCLRRLATVRRNAVVTISGDRRKTGEQFVEDVLCLAFGLLELGIGAGDVVAISALNSDLYLEWLLAIAFVGGIAAPLNYRWSFDEARSAMLLVQPVILVTDESCQSWYSNFQNNDITSLRWHVSFTSPSSDCMKTWNVLTTEILKKHSVTSLPLNYRWASEGAVVICFTSGTCGRPKGVTLTHAALIVQSLAKLTIVGYDEDDVYLHTVPLCHIGGLSSAMAMLMVGGCHVIIPKFEPKSALEAIEQHRVTSLITVPAMMADFLSLIRQKENWKGKDTVKKILNGGGSLSIELIKDATLFFPRAKLLTAYGMSETCSSLTFMTLHDPRMETSSQHIKTIAETKHTSVHQTQGFCVGKPAPHVELKICTDGSSHVGRILTRGPHVMLGYWGQIPAVASDSTNEIWLDTGDIGSIDKNGNLWLTGRANGKIKSGGENIYPEEVEAILLQHPGIIGIVIVGIPDARLTEMAIACIRLTENWLWSDTSFIHSAENGRLVLSTEILLRYCREKNITGFKIPKMFILWEKPFPLTTTGKIKRDQVRREVMSHLQSLHSNL
ncbi:2-succinylbenzoate--CoA ligase, chloroplastic/peroxisomal-like isoform X1 [Juglans microcarpa x Juglans regia]|uniref:2-succinylbenzoate--CoA ligase, chloroplastic/peroxisomal-like isoform X1 n=2 Tax=Juglans microcarpa x Juglans regia TaxID=2249226 RepID=UPI001B7E8882|nr:2-succinylbenzoate--CoA ligase, chloroplastic/peroxisomal-like isoform X1 [Juglans microcarpa x Juglans regia]XP_041027412.1 2-succinylbenzoate--CoA ligase, chloroplastic/peroxisomal-like isoform X1 [Juglans microcarpa x Juglans regia]